MKKIFKRGMSGLLAVLMAFTVIAGFGTTTAFAASETAESYMISFPRDGDAAQIYSEDAWGHSAKTYMNGWATGSSNYTTLHCMDSFDGKVCYCIEPGLSRNVGDTYHGFGEDFWDNYPSQYNNTIEPDDIKLLLGRIMQYGYQGKEEWAGTATELLAAMRETETIPTVITKWLNEYRTTFLNENHIVYQYSRKKHGRQISLAKRAGDSGDGGDSDIGIPPVTVIDA